MIKYIGKNTAGDHIFMNPNHVVAIISNKKGTSHTVVLVSTGDIYEITETWDIIKNNLNE